MDRQIEERRYYSNGPYPDMAGIRANNREEACTLFPEPEGGAQ
jgi:hypothetical protein